MIELSNINIAYALLILIILLLLCQKRIDILFGVVIGAVIGLFLTNSNLLKFGGEDKERAEMKRKIAVSNRELDELAEEILKLNSNQTDIMNQINNAKKINADYRELEQKLNEMNNLVNSKYKIYQNVKNYIKKLENQLDAQLENRLMNAPNNRPDETHQLYKSY